MGNILRETMAALWAVIVDQDEAIAREDFELVGPDFALVRRLSVPLYFTPTTVLAFGGTEEQAAKFCGHRSSIVESLARGTFRIRVPFRAALYHHLPAEERQVMADRAIEASVGADFEAEEHFYQSVISSGRRLDIVRERVERGLPQYDIPSCLAWLDLASDARDRLSDVSYDSGPLTVLITELHWKVHKASKGRSAWLDEQRAAYLASLEVP